MSVIKQEPENEPLSSNVFYFLSALLIVITAILIISTCCSCQRITQEDEQVFVEVAKEFMDKECTIHTEIRKNEKSK